MKAVVYTDDRSPQLLLPSAPAAMCRLPYRLPLSPQQYCCPARTWQVLSYLYRRLFFFFLLGSFKRAEPLPILIRSPSMSLRTLVQTGHSKCMLTCGTSPVAIITPPLTTVFNLTFSHIHNLLLLFSTDASVDQSSPGFAL